MAKNIVLAVELRAEARATLLELGVSEGLDVAEARVLPGNFAGRALHHITEEPTTGIFVVGSTAACPLLVTLRGTRLDLLRCSAVLRDERPVVPELLTVARAGLATALARGLSAVPVFALGAERAAALRPVLWGLAGGLMGVASVVGLLLPALDEGSEPTVALGVVLGAAVLLVARAEVERRDMHVGLERRERAPVGPCVHGAARPRPARGPGDGGGVRFRASRPGPLRRARDRAAELPEGTTSAIPMHDAGFTRGQQF